MKTSKINKKKLIMLFGIFPVAAAAKMFQYIFLSSKYFIDSNKILSIMNGNSGEYGESFHLVADFFGHINIFGLNTLLGWSIYLAMILNIILFIVLLKMPNLKKNDFIYIYLGVFVVNVFAFNLNKEVVQFLIFLAIFLVIKNKNHPNNRKAIIAVGLILLESLLFRSYYVLLAVSFSMVYYLLRSSIERKKNKRFVITTAIAAILFLIVLYVSKYIMPSMYSELLNVRNGYEYGLADANTLIRNVFRGGDSFMAYSLNYIINTIRIIFPIELLLRGGIYIFFVAYQLFNLSIIIKSTKKLSSNNILFVSLLIGYLLLSGTYEPDFGSVIRHESVLLLFFIGASCYSAQRVNVRAGTEGENGTK